MRPQDILPDHLDEARIGDVTVRKGTVAAFLANAAALQDPALTQEARGEVLADLRALLPALRALGLFDVLEVRDPQLRAYVAAH